MNMREDLKLRMQYESGAISAREFINKLFNSKESDRKRREIVERNKASNNPILYGIMKMSDNIRRRIYKHVKK